MNSTPDNSSTITIRPPQLIQSLVSGFNTVASHIYLIALPVLLDLLLWFGPHLRLKALMQPGVQDMLSMMRSTSPAEMSPVLDNLDQLWKLLLEQYNVLSVLSPFPIGLPAMMTSLFPMKTPLGSPSIIEIGSYGQFLLLWLGLTLVGFILGSLYFAGVAYCVTKTGEGQAAASQLDFASSSRTLPGKKNLMAFSTGSRLPPFRPAALAWETLQIILLVVLVFCVGMVLLVPTLLFTSFVALISTGIAQVILFLISFGIIWLLIPLVFAPFGIFLYGQSVIHAVLGSIRVVRFVLPGTGLFLLMVIVINQGLGMLWRTPPDSSWMTLIGIFGNAFISTGLLASCFIFYRSGLIYVQTLRKIALKSI